MEHHIKHHLYFFFPSDLRLPRSCALRKWPLPLPGGMTRINWQLMNKKILRANILHNLLSLTL